MLKDKFDVSYILTSRLNQDVIENLFGCLRQMANCAYSHSSPVQLKYRIRSYIIGRKATLLGSKYNTLEMGTDVCLSKESPSQIMSQKSHSTKRSEDLLHSANVSAHLDANDSQTEVTGLKSLRILKTYLHQLLIFKAQH